MRRLVVIGPVVLGLLAFTVEGAAERQITALASVETVLDGRDELVGVAVTADGARYVSDRGAGSVYRVSAVGALSIALKRLDRPAGLALDAEGRLLIAEEGAGRILRLEPSGALTVLVTGIKKPRWMAAADGSLYISAHRQIPRDDGRRGRAPRDDADASGEEAILRLAPDGTLATVADGMQQVEALALGEGYLDAAAKGLGGKADTTGIVLRYPVLADGSLGTPITLVRGELRQPVGLAPDGLGAEYVSMKGLTLEQDTSKRAIGKIHPDGQLTDFAANLIDPQGLAFGPDGALYLADGKAGRLLEFRAPSALTLRAPAFTNRSPVTVSGTTTPGARVDLFLNGATAPATVTADAIGGFTASITLTPNSTNTVVVYATAGAGNGLSSPPAEAMIVHDDIPPTLAFPTPAAGSYARLDVSVKAQAGDGGSGVATLALSVDGRPLSSTVAPPLPTPSAAAGATWSTTTVPDGAHTLGAVTVDRATNTTATTRVVIVDNTPPDTQITSGPSGVIQVASATFTFTGTDFLTPVASLRFAWRVDGGAFAPFDPQPTAPLTGLSEGLHTFEVKALDLAGNEDPTPAVRTFTVRFPPSITSVDPARGPAGTLVTITGERFDPDTQVTFAGVSAVVLSQAPTGITTRVPVGAVTGPLVVTNSRGSATATFTVPPPPVITSFVPTRGGMGDTVVIIGTGFDPTPANNVARFNGTPALVVSAEPTRLTVQVPAGATSGPIGATTPAGSATSAQSFTVVGRVPRIVATVDPPFLQPTDIQVSRDGRRAYVVNQGRNTVSVIDSASHSIIATMPAGAGAFRSVITPDSARLYVLNRLAVSVTVFDLATNGVVTTIPLVATDAALLAMSPDGRSVLVTNPTDARVSLIDTATNTVATRIPVGRWPSGIAASPDNRRVYVHNVLDDTISVVDVVSRTVVATIASGRFTGSATFGVFTPDGARYYTTDGGNNVVVVDTATNAVTNIAGPFSSPVAAAVHPTAGRLYVGDSFVRPSFQPAVVVLDTRTNAVVATLSVGGDPRSIVVTPDGQRVVVAATRENTAAVIDPATNTVASVVRLNAATPLVGAALTGGRLVYIVGRDSNSLSVLDLAVNGMVDAPVSRTGAPQDLLVATRAGDKVFGSAGFTTAFLAALDTRTNTALPNTTIPRSPARSAPVLAAVAADPVTGGTVYLDDSRSLIYLMDVATGTLTSTIAKSTAGSPARLLVTPDGSRLFSIDASRIAVIDVATRTQLGVTSFTGGVGAGIANAARTTFYAGAVLGAGSFAVRGVDLNTTTVVATVPVPFQPSQLALTGDERKLLVVGRFNTSIPVIDTVRNTVVATLAPGGGIYNDLVTSPTPPRAFLANGGANRVDVIDTSANAVVGSVALPDAPVFLAISGDGARLYAVQSRTGVISVIDTQTLSILVNLTVAVGTNGLQRPIVAPNGRLYVPHGDFGSLIVVE